MTDEATDSTPDSTPEPMRLDHFLKISGLAESGGQAKVLIQAGEVKLNGEVETRRRKKLTAGDIVEVGGERIVVPKE